MNRPEGVRAAQPREEEDFLDVLLDKGTKWLCYGALVLAGGMAVFLAIVQVSR